MLREVVNLNREMSIKYSGKQDSRSVVDTTPLSSANIQPLRFLNNEAEARPQ